MTQKMTHSVLFTGSIWCPESGDLTALAVAHGRIVAVGDDALGWAPRAGVRNRVETGDGLLLPAFADGHAHPLFGGLEAAGPQIRPQRSMAAIVAEVGRFAAEHPELAWIRGASYDSSLSPEGLFDARWLDEVVPDRPVALRAWDYHTVWVNSRALELAGITAGTPDPPLGEIPRRPDGSVLGTLREWGAVDLVMDAAGPPPIDDMVTAIETAGRHYAALGVTWVQDAWVGPHEVPAYLAAARADRLPVRFNLALYADPRLWPGQLETLVDARRAVEELGHPRLTANTVKFFADGVVESATAALLAGYASEPGNTGMLVWSPQLLRRAVTQVDTAGFQPHLHTIGDRAVRVALDAVEHAAAANGPRDRRPVLAHVQLLDAADRDRFARLGVIANAEPLWAQLDDLMTVLTIPRLGEQRSDTQYPWSTLRATGAALSFGSDWPVSEANPLEGIAVACSRQTREREPAGGWMPQERLTVEQALTAYTAAVGHQAFRNAGTLRPGADADLVLLSADPRRLAVPRDIDTLRVTGTWLAGRRICGDGP